MRCTRAEGHGRSRRSGSASCGTGQNALFGDSVSTEGYTPWWSYIPHFTGTPGYVYAYAYGYLFSLAIYRRYVKEGESMIEKPYLDLLRAGGSRPPEEARREPSGSISPIRPSGPAGSTPCRRRWTRPSASPGRSGSPSHPHCRASEYWQKHCGRDRLAAFAPPLEGVRMRKVVLLATALVVALGTMASSATSASTRTGSPLGRSPSAERSRSPAVHPCTPRFRPR